MLSAGWTYITTYKQYNISEKEFAVMAVDKWIDLHDPTVVLTLDFLDLKQLPTIPSNCQSLNCKSNSCSVRISLRSAHDVRFNEDNK